jgi:Tfp pilus assembly protein PilF
MKTRLSSTLVVLVTTVALGACRQDPATKVRGFVSSGDNYVKQGKFAEAAVQYRNAIQTDPQAADARVKLGETLLQTGDFANALGEYVRAADLRPEDNALQVKAGSLLLLAGRAEDAKARVSKVLEREPKNVDAQIVTANALAGLKDVDAAVSQIEDALRVDPNRSGTYSNLGALELSRGKRDAAERRSSAPRSCSPTRRRCSLRSATSTG